MARPGFPDRERIEAVVNEELASGMLRWPVAGTRPSTKSAEHVGADIPLEHCHPAVRRVLPLRIGRTISGWLRADRRCRYRFQILATFAHRRWTALAGVHPETLSFWNRCRGIL
jgi:hypothetical protein